MKLKQLVLIFPLSQSDCTVKK